MARRKKYDGQCEAQKVFASWKLKYKLAGVSPTDPCHKCGKSYWTEGDEPLCWSCIQCGNVAYLSLGVFHQQIDTILRSDRKVEYVKSEGQDKVLPKKNNEVKAIRFKVKKT